MTISNVDFPTWFSFGCYGGLACCMFAIAVNALYTSLRRRGTTRQLASTIVTCVISALLLLPALVWYTMRFSVEQAALSTAEVELALVYVALFGWFLPLSVTTAYCLFALPRTSTTSTRIPRQKRTTRANASTAFNPPRRQAGVVAPYIFSEDTPWGWLEYRGGRFQGQRLALKRTVVSIGRGEENDIWLDDDMASRNHAELAWEQGCVYITDCDSLNGVLLSGKRIRTTALVEPGELLEIGSHRFIFEKAEQAGTPPEHDDPLTRHVWHSVASLQTESEKLPMTLPLEEEDTLKPPISADMPAASSLPDETASALDPESQVTAALSPISSLPQSVYESGLFTIQNGERVGQSFSLEHAVMTIGRDPECEVVINDVSISRRHAQFLRQTNGLYVQDLGSRNGTRVNDELLHAPRLLQTGDIVCLGSIRLAYSSVPMERSTPVPLSVPQPSWSVGSTNGRGPLRLPSKPK